MEENKRKSKELENSKPRKELWQDRWIQNECYVCGVCVCTRAELNEWRDLSYMER